MLTKEKILIYAVLIVPFLRGLYFYHSQYFVTAIFLIILFMYINKKEQVEIDYSLKSSSLYLIVLFYGISVFYAVDVGMAFFGFLKWGSILIFYILIMQIESKYKILNAVAYSGLLLVSISIISIFIPILKQYTFQDNRLGSFIQYANALCVYLIVSFVIVIQKDKLSIYEKITIPLLFSCIILSFSRSMNIIALFVVVYCFIKEKGKRKNIALEYFIGIFIGLLLSKYAGVSNNISRIQNTSFSAGEWQSRIMYYKDGLKILMNNPLGLGYLGYYYVQRTYQSAVYFVKYIHSSILQIGIDIGWIGIILFFIMFYDYFFNVKTQYYKKLIVIIILVHSLIDIDWEFPIFFMIISLIFADEQYKIKRYKISKAKKMIPIVLVVVYIYFGTAAFLHYCGSDEQAYSMYPWYTEANIRYVEKLYNNKEKQSVMLTKKFLKQNKYVPKAYIILKNWELKRQNYDLAVQYAKKIRDLVPLDIECVEKYSEILLLSAKYDIINNDFEGANKYLQEILSIESYIKVQKNRISKRAYKLKRIPKMVMTKKLLDDKMSALKMLRRREFYVQ